MATIAYKLSVDWNNDGDWSDANEDISADVLSMEWSYGRDQATQLIGRSLSGKLTARLKDPTGKYASFNSASALFGNIVPGRKVKLQGGNSTFPWTFPVVFNDVVHWQGFLESIEPDVVAPGELQTVTLVAVGPLGYLNQFEAALPMATSKLTGSAIGDILDDVGWAAGDRDIDTGQTTMDRVWVDKQETIKALRKIEETEAGFIRETKDGKIAFEDRHHRLKSPHYTSQATFSDAVGAALSYASLKQIDPLPFIFNEMVAAVKKYTVGGLAVLWTLAQSGADSPAIEAGEAIEFWASYPNPDSATDAIGVDAWTTPVATTDYTANTAADGSGTDKTADMAVVVTKLGNSMKITITNNAGVKVFLTLLQARGTGITADDPVRIAKRDATSQTAYGKRSYPAPGEFIPDVAEATSWAGFHLGIYKDPIPLLEMEIAANRDNTHLMHALIRDVSERITVVANRSGGALMGINRDFFIEAIAHRVEAGGLHRTKFLLSDAEGFSDWWVLGVSELGTSTRLAY